MKPGAVTTPMVISNHTESAPLQTNALSYLVIYFKKFIEMKIYIF